MGNFFHDKIFAEAVFLANTADSIRLISERSNSQYVELPSVASSMEVNRPK